METKYFSLGQAENSKMVKILQVVFGLLCIGIAVFWLIFNLRSIKAAGTSWVTIIFIGGFGLYQIYAGLGFSRRFIEIGPDKISIRKDIMLPAIVISAGEMEKFEIYPFNLILFLKTRKKVMLRLGATYQETNEKIKDEILIFGEQNSISVEFVEEKL
jgi:hypothetical protein